MVGDGDSRHASPLKKVVNFEGLAVSFFSSRRRHTRWTGDWSSDVCFPIYRRWRREHRPLRTQPVQREDLLKRLGLAAMQVGRTIVDAEQRGDIEAVRSKRNRCSGVVARSEERRVGNECRAGWVAGGVEKN